MNNLRLYDIVKPWITYLLHSEGVKYKSSYRPITPHTRESSNCMWGFSFIGEAMTKIRKIINILLGKEEKEAEKRGLDWFDFTLSEPEYIAMVNSIRSNMYKAFTEKYGNEKGLPNHILAVIHRLYAPMELVNILEKIPSAFYKYGSTEYSAYVLGSVLCSLESHIADYETMLTENSKLGVNSNVVISDYTLISGKTVLSYYPIEDHIEDINLLLQYIKSLRDIIVPINLFMVLSIVSYTEYRRLKFLTEYWRHCQ